MSKSVCIIGAGPSGLVAAKTLLHNAPSGSFKVTVFDSQHDIGGLWPTSKTDSRRQVHPLMVANQSKHTVQFSGHAWQDGAPQFPLAWQVGQYLQRYLSRLLEGRDDFELKLKTKVVSAVPKDEGGKGWDVVASAEENEGVKVDKREFDYVIVASGFFGKPIIPESLSGPSDVPAIHSSGYRDLKSLLGKGKPGGGKILVVGGQMSGVEIAGTIAAHLSSAANASEDCGIQDIDKYTVHHVIQRPIWVFPLFTSPEPRATAAPFLPLDLGSYNLNNRPHPLVNGQGHITEDAAKIGHTIYEAVLGNDQSIYSDHLKVKEEEKTAQPYLAVSDWYCEFVRTGLITLSKGKVESLSESTATISPDDKKVEDIAAVVVATGFDASPRLDFLPRDLRQKLDHVPQDIGQPVALAFHGTHHPDVPGLGFVGFYRSPYWGVMQMQARFLATYWSQASGIGGSAKLADKLGQDVSIQRTLDLRGDPRCSQFPMGDYPYLVQEMAEALGVPITEPLIDGLPKLSHNDKPLNILTPARYTDPSDSNASHGNTQKLLNDTRNVALTGLTTPRFVARAVFRSLLGTWNLERDLNSKLPSHPSGRFSGKAHFLLRQKTTHGLQCATDDTFTPTDEDGLEYLYIEEGEFKTESGFGFTATRRYIWRYDEKRDKLSVWFVKPEELKTADYLFHEIEFKQPVEGRREEGWKAGAGHLCIEDFYDVEYGFKFKAVNLKEWSVGYDVRGPKKDYTIRGRYTR